MAGNYYNGYTKSLPRTAKYAKFQLTYSYVSIGNRLRTKVELFYTQDELDTFLAGLVRAAEGPDGNDAKVVLLERWKRGTGWVTL